MKNYVVGRSWIDIQSIMRKGSFPEFAAKYYF